jgi:hypothetical protein
MKTICVVLLALSIVANAVHAGEYLETLKENCWLCQTPEAYDSAVAEEKQQNGDLEPLKARLLEQKACIYVDRAFVSRIMVPYAQVLERQDDKVKVTFMVQYRKRVEDLHRQISRVQFTGWTNAKNLLKKEIM